MRKLPFLFLLAAAAFSTTAGFEAKTSGGWPVLKRYDADHLEKIALPLGGIGTGTVSLGGRGDLRDWEIMNRPAKGYVPDHGGRIGPFFALYTRTESGRTSTRILEGPLPFSAYQESHGSTAVNHGLPRFRKAGFAAAYPLGQVFLSDPDLPVEVTLEAFNPLIPGDADSSGLPLAALRYVIRNTGGQPLRISVCGSIPNFIGEDGSHSEADWKGDPQTVGARGNRNLYREGDRIRGLFLTSDGVDPESPAWGTIALVTTAEGSVTARTAWLDGGWGSSPLDFWDDFSRDGCLEPRDAKDQPRPMASLAVETELAPHAVKSIPFLLTWHFPNRMTWTPKGTPDDRIGNYYTTLYRDAWQAAESSAPRLAGLERKTVEFVRSFCGSSLPDVVKEAALFNLSTLRTQTCFRTRDGRFFGYEGSSNRRGCCHGSCTHVWNYEQATAFLFGDLARSMRETEFLHATDDQGMMSFRVNLPLARAREFGKAAADGQMGCIMKIYRDWRLSGDDEWLSRLWPRVKKALAFCWIEGGWDADRDGVMEGAQHNTMDVEYYGPNPQMGFWYLGALRAAGEMADYLQDTDFAQRCRDLFRRGSAWIDTHLFNGEYYEHEVRPVGDRSHIAPSLLIGMGASDPAHPDYQLGPGCLVDQLVGQYMAHVCGLGHLAEPENIRTTLDSIFRYNHREGFTDFFNCMRSFAMGEESGLLMAGYPRGRPDNPFPYFTEVMTGFEYAAAIGMIFEGRTETGLSCIRDIRARYDGLKRNPFDEAECGHHYARAMASWAAVPALTGYHYSGVDKSMEFAPRAGTHFWSNGRAWGNCRIEEKKSGWEVEIALLGGGLEMAKFRLSGAGIRSFSRLLRLAPGETRRFTIPKEKSPR